jgi:hypothetical protein
MNTFILASIVLLQLVGGTFTYTVQKGDSLTSIGARFGVDARVLAESNSLEGDKLATGKTLKIDSRHIVPPSNGVAIVVNVPQRMLFHFAPGSASEAYPIAAGRPSLRTEIGDFQILRMEENPTWDEYTSKHLPLRDAWLHSATSRRCTYFVFESEGRNARPHHLRAGAYSPSGERDFSRSPS